MLHYSRWKTAAILGVTVLVCLAAVPSALPADAFARLPAWAQRKFELGYDLQGGERVQLIVNEERVHRVQLERLQDDMRQFVRGQRIAHAGANIRGNGVEITIREVADVPRVVAALSEYVQPRLEPPRAGSAVWIPADGRASLVSARTASIPPRELDMTITDRVIRLTFTDAAISEHRRLATRASIEFIKRYLGALGVPHEFRRAGDGRIAVEVAADLSRLPMY